MSKELSNSFRRRRDMLPVASEHQRKSNSLYPDKKGGETKVPIVEHTVRDSHCHSSALGRRYDSVGMDVGLFEASVLEIATAALHLIKRPVPLTKKSWTLLDPR